MSTSVVLPALGESVTEGTVTRWLKNVGDAVREDEGLLEISTDKVDTEIPSPVSGIVEEILVAEDETVEVGAVLARIGDGSTGVGADAPAAEAAAPEAAPAAAPEAAPTPEPGPAPAAPSVAPAVAATGRDVLLPELGESVTEGTVTRWLKQVGDAVQTDEPLLEISTDKVDTEIPSPFTGVLAQILVAEDETVAVGSVLGRIGDGTAPVAPAPAPAAAEPAVAAVAPSAPEPPAPEPVAPAAPAAAAPAPAAPAAAASAPSAPTAPSPTAPPPPQTLAVAVADDAVYVTPLVRRLARQQGVDLATVHGTGVGGRIRKEDVLRAASEAAATPAPVPDVSGLRGTTRPMSRLRAVLAERAVSSAQQTARLSAIVEADVTNLTSNAAATDSLFAVCVLAVAGALQEHPTLNAVVDGVSIVYPPTENVSISVDTDRGALAPVVHDAASKSVAELTRELADLNTRSHGGRLTPDELAGGTFTISDAGAHGALIDLPLVNLPQTASLAVGAVVKRPGVVTVDGKDAIAVRSYAYLALSYDHRIVDGAEAGRFLDAVKSRLEAAAPSAA